MAFLVSPHKGLADHLWLQSQLERFERHLLERMRAPSLTRAPNNPSEGMIVIADGTLWDPGSGGGFYGYRNGNWEKLQA